jgi:hypothetical protein
MLRANGLPIFSKFLRALEQAQGGLMFAEQLQRFKSPLTNTTRTAAYLVFVSLTHLAKGFLDSRSSSSKQLGPSHVGE